MAFGQVRRLLKEEVDGDVEFLGSRASISYTIDRDTGRLRMVGDDTVLALQSG